MSFSKVHRSSLVLVLLALFLLASAWLSLVVGPVRLQWNEVAHALLGFHASSATALIVQEIRLPRMLLGFMVGGSLGMAGAVMQGYLRNPLAEPALLGVSSGAALGAVLAIYSGAALLLPLATPLAGMVGALIAVMLVALLAGKRSSVHSLILAGVAVSSLLGAGIALVLNMAENPFAAMEIVFWLMGSIADRSMAEVLLAIPLMAVGWWLMLSVRTGLDALSLGEETAASLGISLLQLQMRVTLGVALSVGAAVSVAGSIGFIGLVVPHLLRPFIGYQPSKIVLPSWLVGAILVTLADCAVRVIPTTGAELKLGVVTALLGGPFFLLLLLYTRRRLV